MPGQYRDGDETWFCDSDETQRAHYTARRKEVWEALHPEPTRDYSLESYDADDELEVGKVYPPQVFSHGGARPQTKGFAAATAEVTGESKRAINLNLARAEAIGDDLLRLTGTSLDKGVELDALAKLPGQYRDGDEKVLPAHLEQGCNAGAANGSFSASWGLLFRRGQTVGGGGEIRRGVSGRSTDAVPGTPGPAKS